MSNEPTQQTQNAVDVSVFETANDRFKRSFGSWFWGSMLAAVMVHFVVMAFWPNLRAADVSFTMEDMEAVELPPEIEIPPPPEQIQRPANPVVSEAMIDDDITIAPTTFDDNQPDDLPPPPSQAEAGLGDEPTFTPFTVAPEVRNRAEIQRVLEREYPSTLRDAGIGGTVVMHFFIDEEGVVQNTVVDQSSGHAALDAAAERVAQAFEFTPALNRDQRVPVWISIPIVFQSR
jgi:periplasmic protein TonB